MKTKKLNKVVSVLALLAILAGSVGGTSLVNAQEAPPTVKVTILKYIGDDKATSESADNNDFQMSATWNAENIGAGTGQYALSEIGFNGDSTPYQAVTSDMTSGADYATNEIMDSTVGATCDADEPFALVGYSSGNTLQEAEAATLSLTPPAFTGLTNDKFVIVWNKDCSIVTPPASVKVTINKFVDGDMATVDSADSASFPMSATWRAENIGAGTGEYALGAGGDTPYQAMTVDMDRGADYSTNEILTRDTVGATCDADEPFALQGYSVGNTYNEAKSASVTMTVPTFTNIQNDKYVIVWNEDCDSTGGEAGGEIGGNVVGSNGVLAVTSIESIDTTATANGTYEDGWKYIFHITAPTNEQDLAMKFSDWLRNGGNGTIPVANNMRISSAQANNSGAKIVLTAANVYSVPALHMTTDLNPAMIGRQVEVTVEVAVPNGTPDGSYTTNYGVKTTQ